MLIGGRRAGLILLLLYILCRTSQWTSAGAFLVERLTWADRWQEMWVWLMTGWIAGVISTGCLAAYAEWSALESWPRQPPPRAARGRNQDRHRFW